MHDLGRAWIYLCARLVFVPDSPTDRPTDRPSALTGELQITGFKQRSNQVKRIVAYRDRQRLIPQLVIYSFTFPQFCVCKMQIYVTDSQSSDRTSLDFSLMSLHVLMDYLYLNKHIYPENYCLLTNYHYILYFDSMFFVTIVFI